MDCDARPGAIANSTFATADGFATSSGASSRAQALRFCWDSRPPARLGSFSPSSRLRGSARSRAAPCLARRRQRSCVACRLQPGSSAHRSRLHRRTARTAACPASGRVSRKDSGLGSYALRPAPVGMKPVGMNDRALSVGRQQPALSGISHSPVAADYGSARRPLRPSTHTGSQALSKPRRSA